MLGLRGVQCTFIGGFLTMRHALNLTAYQITGGHAAILVDTSNQPAWALGSLSGTLNLGLTNSGNITANFSMVPTGCCVVQSDSTCQVTNAITVTTAPAQTLAPAQAITQPFTIGACLACCDKHDVRQ